MKKIIKTEKAPKAIGPYSQGVVAGGFLFVSGQIPINPSTGEQIRGTITEQTRQVLENLGGVLKAGGYDYKDVVKASVFLKSMDSFKEMGEVYKEYFKTDPPAREAVEVAGLPLGFDVEISVIAYKKE
jgi:2-iminobutanoate/2-iminopropanoate deaminase